MDLRTRVVILKLGVPRAVLALLQFTSLPRALDMGGENLYIDTKDVQKLLIMRDSAIRLLITLGARSAWRRTAKKTAQRPRCY
jgi:hypothetical protein